MPEFRLSFYQGDERVRQSESIDQLAPAFLAAQEEIGAAAKTGKNPRFQDRPYATRDDVLQAAKPILAKHGLAFTQGASVQGDYVVVETKFIHKSGQWFETGVPFKPPAEDPQKVGGVMTYGSRYGLVAALGIEGEEDDDANSVSPEPGRRGGYRDTPAPARNSAPRPVQNQQRSGGGSSNGGGSNGRYGNLPRSGKQMFPWAKTQGENFGVDLVKYLNSWSKLHDFPFKMIEWDDEQVAAAVAEATRKLDSIQPADNGGGQDDEADFNF